MANKDSARIGALLRQHRAAIGLTQEQLASRAGLSPDTIRALEHGRGLLQLALEALRRRHERRHDAGQRFAGHVVGAGE